MRWINVILVAVLASGCSTSASPGSVPTKATGAPTAASVPPSAAPAPSAATGHSWRIPDVEMADRDGYTFKMTGISISAAAPSTVSVENSKPGYAIIKEGSIAAEWSIKNTTPSRNAQIPYMQIIGVIPVESEAECEELRASPFGKTKQRWCEIAIFPVGGNLKVGESATYHDVRPTINRAGWQPVLETSARQTIDQDRDRLRDAIWFLTSSKVQDCPTGPSDQPTIVGGSQLTIACPEGPQKYKYTSVVQILSSSGDLRG